MNYPQQPPGWQAPQGYPQPGYRPPHPPPPPPARNSAALKAAFVVGGLVVLVVVGSLLGRAEPVSTSHPAAHAGTGTGAGPASSAPTGPAVAAAVEVTVQATKPSGEPWDGAGDPPDLALCVSSGGSTRCYPDGTSLATVRHPQCRDALACTFQHVQLPAGAALQVVDVDVLENDSIGEGTCAVGAPCTIGQATVTVHDETAEAEAERHRQAAEQASFDAMTSAQHLATARTLMADGFDAHDRVGGRLDDAARHLHGIAPTAHESHEAQGLLHEIDGRTQRAAQLLQRSMARAAHLQREQIARELDQSFIDHGIEVDSVRLTGTDGTTLHINYALCGRVFVNEIARTQGDELHRAGFRRVECGSGLEEAWIALE